jgi:glyoxylase-like metal-dependent hydrolase (beta-lactamase superfamily II)
MRRGDMEIHRLTDWLWCLHTPVVQAYAVREGDGFNLVDASIAGQEDAILDALASVAGGEARVSEVLVTHGHDDHTGSAAALAQRTGARVLGPAADAAVIEGERPAPPPSLADWEVPLYEQARKNVPPAPPVALDARVGDGSTLDWEHAARIVAAPGHTAGSVAVLFEDDRVLVAGDAIASFDGKPIVGVFNIDRGQATETFRRLAGLDVDVACFGHGDPLVGGAGARLAEIAASL